MHRLVFLSLLLIAIPASPATDSVRRHDCKTPELAASCYWTHGRLLGAEGTPSTRLWKIGTKRILGIYSSRWDYWQEYNGKSQDGEDSENPYLPPNLQAKFKPMQNWIYADFEVCPLMPEKPEVMQPACIEAAKNIVVKE